jgi:hypothetical protein
MKFEDKTCLFSSETEPVTHLFFDCRVLQSLWGSMADITDSSKKIYFESTGDAVVESCNALNVCSTALLWTI